MLDDPLIADGLEMCVSPAEPSSGGRLQGPPSGKTRGERTKPAAALAASENRLRLALEAADACAWDVDPATGLSTWDPASEALVGLVGTLDYRQALARFVHPLDLPAMLTAITGALDPTGDGRYTVEHRVLVSMEGRKDSPGEPRWFQSQGRVRFGPRRRRLPADAVRLVCITRDITERRAAEDRQTLLIAELNHRVKNTLANVLALVEQTRRSTDTRQPGAASAPERRRFHTDLQGRLLALARVHDLLTHQAWGKVELSNLVRLATSPFAAVDRPERIQATGPPLSLAPQAAISLAMALHELCGNAVRHGALSVPAGRVSLEWSIEPAEPGDTPPAEGTAPSGSIAPAGNIAAVLWREHDGPSLAGPPMRRGFGSRLLERGVALQFGGVIRLEFPAEGLVCHMRLPLRPETIDDLG